MAEYSLWCMEDKDGKLQLRTLSLRNEKRHVHYKMFDLMPESFRTEYWKRLRPSQAALRKLGYRIVKVKVSKVKS